MENANSISYIIAGLGNFGKEYENTRHNAGFIAADALCKRLYVKADRQKYKSLVTEARIADTRVLIMKPLTYMNDSGIAIREAAAFYKIPPEKLIVVYDDVNLDPGELRIR